MKRAPGCAQVLKEHADSRLARDAVARLTPVVTAQREKLKEEMFGAPHARQHAEPCMQACAALVSSKHLCRGDLNTLQWFACRNF